MRASIGKLGYGFVFCALLPALLVCWAAATEKAITWHMVGPARIIVGTFTLCAGALFMIWAMMDLWRRGKGLPMNAFPPERFVDKGAYGLMRHPIYAGACVCWVGFSLCWGSASALYLVAPMLTLGCCALVHGYEADATRGRFGEQEHRVLFSLPASSDEPTGRRERAVVSLLVFGSWLLLYELVVFIGPDPRAIDTFLQFERSRAVIAWAEPVYAITYPFVVLVPWLMRTRAQLTAFAKNALWAVGIGIFLQAVLPLKAVPLAIDASNGAMSRLILWERSMDGPAAAFPSFHVLWALIAGRAYARAYPDRSIAILAVCVLLVWSCLATGAHSFIDVAGGLLAYLFVIGRERCWGIAQDTCERLANSWAEWRIGPVRIISHGLFAAVGGAVCMVVAAAYGGDPWSILVTCLCGLVVAALWGQFVEGSPRLLRPFGFYGSVIGVVLGAFIVEVTMDAPFSRTLTVLALAAPWMQAVGRMRCLVQGCCHGRLQKRGRGIRYTDPHTRVCSISGLRGRSIHNTQLYSIISNTLIGAVLWRMAWSGAQVSLIIGVYLLLGSLTRFVEEHFRGEPQTRVLGGLRLYQWIALAGSLVGGIVTCIPSSPFEFTAPFSASTWLVAAIGGIAAGLAMGVDFPTSNTRFSRLSG